MPAVELAADEEPLAGCPPALVCLTAEEARETTAELARCEGAVAAAGEPRPCPAVEPIWWEPTAARVAWAGAVATVTLLLVVLLR